MPNDFDPYYVLLDQAKKKAAHCYGYAHIFNKRASFYGWWLNWIKIFGLLLPGSIGLAVGQFGNTPLLNTWVNVTWFLSLGLFAVSLVTFFFKWDDELTYSFEASQNYNILYDRFNKLTLVPPTDFSQLEKQYDLLSTEYRLRNEQDAKHGIKEYERRRGMRWALREFQMSCVGCETVPKSMDSTDCPVCGKFSFKYKIAA